MTATTAAETSAAIIEMSTPETQALQQRAPTVAEQAKAIKVVDQATSEKAAEILKTIKALRDDVEATFGPITKRAFETHREAVAQRKKVEEPLIQAENAVKASLGAYLTEQERIRQAELRRLQEEELRRQQEEQEKQIEAMEAQGASAVDVASAIEQAEAAPIRAVAVAPPPVAKPAGISTRVAYTFEITNFRLFAQNVVKDSNLINLLQVNQTALNQLVRACQGNLKIPGMVVRQITGVAARR